MEIRKVRDLTLIRLDDKRTMVIACDSCGGIGMKEGDTFKVPPFILGKFASRVPLLEVICTGAEVITIADTVSNEMVPTGEEIIKGIKAELEEAGIEDIVLTGSTEENFKTTATAVGVTVVGIADSDKLKVNKALPDAVVISIGLPKVGGEINLQKDDEIINYSTVKDLLRDNSVYEIVPVGSKGIMYEAEQMALYNGLKFVLDNSITVDINKSGGPAACAIAAVAGDSVLKMQNSISNINLIGHLERTE